MNRAILWTGTYWRILLATLFLFIPYSLYLPVMPLYVKEELAGSLTMASLVNAVFLLASVLFRTQTSCLERFFGQKTTLQYSSLGFVISNLFYLLTTSVPLILLIRTLSGVCFAIMNTAMIAFGSQSVPASRRGEGIGYLTLVVTAGGAIGPFIGLQLAGYAGYAWVFVFCALCTLTGYLIMRTLPLTELHQPFSLARYAVAARRMIAVDALPGCSVILLLSLAYTGVLSFVALYAKEIGVAAGAYFFVVMALASVVVRLVSGRWLDAYGPNRLLYPCFAMFAAGLLLLAVWPTTAGLLLAAWLLGLAYGVAVPGLQTVVISRSTADNIPMITATYFTCLDLGLGAGAYIMGAAMNAWGYSTVYFWLAPFTLLVGGLYYRVLGRSEEAADWEEAAS